MKAFLRGFGAGFKEFSQDINALVNTLLLTFVYVFGVGVTSIAGRLAGKRFLATEKSDGDTYWQDIEPHLRNRTLDESYRQF